MVYIVNTVSTNERTFMKDSEDQRVFDHKLMEPAATLTLGPISYLLHLIASYFWTSLPDHQNLQRLDFITFHQLHLRRSGNRSNMNSIPVIQVTGSASGIRALDFTLFAISGHSCQRLM